MSKSKDTFSVGNDLLAAFEGCASQIWWAMLEWAVGFYERTGRPATLRDFMAERPTLEYRGVYE